MATPHNAAEKGDFAKIVLMPGDPLRAKFIAETYLEDTKLVNGVRNMYGYTGFYQGERISIMSAGMGMPSMGIYSYELFHHYDVDVIIRIGSAGAIQESMGLKEIVIAQGASTDSNYGAQYQLPGQYAPLADFSLIEKAVQAARKQNKQVQVGNVLSTDIFYTLDPKTNEKWKSMGVLAVEMECAALYYNAAEAGKKALGMLTISDQLCTGEVLTAQERQLGFCDMIEVALETAVSVLQEQKG